MYNRQKSRAGGSAVQSGRGIPLAEKRKKKKKATKEHQVRFNNGVTGAGMSFEVPGDTVQRPHASRGRFGQTVSYFFLRHYCVRQCSHI
jgi:hypothetical protein